MSLWKSIEDTLRDMERVNAHAAKLGRDMVIAEAAYYGAKSRAAFGLKEQGYAVTFIEMAVKGVPEVAEAMMEYHMAQIEYDNARVRERHEEEVPGAERPASARMDAIGNERMT